MTLKKSIFIISLISCLAVAVGCSCSQEAQVTPAITTEETTTEAPEATTAPATTEVPDTTEAPETTATVKEVTVSLTTLVSDETASISYPVLSGLSDSSKETKWNDYFVKDAQDLLDSLEAGDTVTSSWQVVSGSARVMSLVKKTAYTAADSPYPVYSLETLNIDTNTGSAMRLSQLCDTTAIAADIAEKENACTVTAPDGTDVTEDLNLEVLIDLNSRFVGSPAPSDTAKALTRILNQVDYNGDTQVSGYSYWKDGVLHIVFPYIHAVGDYIDLEIKDAHRTSSTK